MPKASCQKRHFGVVCAVCGSESDLLDEAIPIIVSLFQVTIVLYTLNPNGDQHTMTFKYTSGNVLSTFIPKLVAPGEKSKTIYMIHTNGNHYMYLKPN